MPLGDADARLRLMSILTSEFDSSNTSASSVAMADDGCAGGCGVCVASVAFACCGSLLSLLLATMFNSEYPGASVTPGSDGVCDVALA